MMTQTVETRLRNAGYRVTKQRTAVYQYLLSTDAHPTAETIHLSVRHRLPNISLATIYKAVDSLVDVGLVNRIQRLRKDSGLEITDRIRLAISGPQEIRSAADRFREFISGETLAVSLTLGAEPEQDLEAKLNIQVDDLEAVIALSRESVGDGGGAPDATETAD